MPVTISNATSTVSFLEPVSFIGTLGGIFGTVGNILKGIGIRSGTVHPNQTQANEIANVFADEVYRACREAYTPAQLVEIGKRYSLSMVSRLGSVSRWSNQDSWAPRAVPISQITQTINDASAFSNPLNSIRHTTFYYGVWVARNSDAGRPDDFVQVVKEDISATLVPAIEGVTGTKVTAIPGVGTSGGSTSGDTIGLAALASPEKMLLVLAVAGIVFAIFRRKGK